MENRPKTTAKTVEIGRSTQPKFKNLNIEYNQLQSKYDIYKNGTPNNYRQDLQSLKAYNIKNNIKTLELPSIEYILQVIKHIPENTGTNQRDFNIHPSMLQKYGNKFKSMTSDQQEIKDFICWYNKKQKQIVEGKGQNVQKFYLYQNLIGSSYNEMITQISQISRSRSQILHMLWNKQNKQYQRIINILHNKTTFNQKQNLETIKKLHLNYQQEIVNIKNTNYNLEKENEQAHILNESCINTLRIARKQLKKYEKVIKQLCQANYFFKEQTIRLLEQNISLQQKQKNPQYEKLRVIGYKRLYIQKIKKQLYTNNSNTNIITQIKNKAEHMINNKQVTNMQEKKQKLVKYIKSRIKSNCKEKLYIMKGQFSESDDEDIALSGHIQELLTHKQYRLEIQSKIPKQKSNFFLKQASVNTDLCPIANSKASVAVQTMEAVENNEKQIIDLRQLNKRQEVQDKKKLRDKKVLQRHTLMMIQMNKMLEFKKIDNSKKIRNLSRYNSLDNSQSLSQSQSHSQLHSYSNSQTDKNSNILSTSNHIKSNLNQNHNGISQNVRYTSLNDQKLDISQQSQKSQELSDQSKDQYLEQPPQKQKQKKETQNWQINSNREENIKRRHHESLLTQKSYEFQNMISRISKDLSDERDNEAKQQEHGSVKEAESDKVEIQPRMISTFSQPQRLNKSKQNKVSRFKDRNKTTNEQQKILQYKQLVKKYLSKRGEHKQQISNAEKHLKKILTDTFKNLYNSKKTNFLNELIKTSKNSYGKIVYQSKLIHLLSIIIENKQKSLLAALTILINIWGFDQNLIEVNSTDVNQLYFKLYFNLSLKSPTENHFNIWNNYTNIQKLNTQSFMDILKTYFHDNKCLYLQLKIREFIGFTPQQHIQNNYYVQLNPLMMYILQVYLSEKKNYYQSYHQIIDFLSDGDYLTIETFVFMLDLLCFKQEEQKEIVEQYFKEIEGQQQSKSKCKKDIFYRICVRYQVPLFQFIKILKLEQFKKLHEYIKNDFIDINDWAKWNRVKDSLQKKIKSKNKYSIGLKKVIEKLNSYIKDCHKIQNQPFLFFYRIVIFIAFGESNSC